MSPTATARFGEALDRLRELTNIGAGHAADALAALLGRTIRMRVPRVRRPESAVGWEGDQLQAQVVVLFDVHGGPGGKLAVVFPGSSLDELVDAVLGAPIPEHASQLESALCEAGNVLASHALSAVADALGARVIPSVPELRQGDFDPARVLAAETGAGAGVRIDSELVDEAGRPRGMLVWIPEARAGFI